MFPNPPYFMIKEKIFNILAYKFAGILGVRQPWDCFRRQIQNTECYNWKVISSSLPNLVNNLPAYTLASGEVSIDASHCKSFPIALI